MAMALIRGWPTWEEPVAAAPATRVLRYSHSELLQALRAAAGPRAQSPRPTWLPTAILGLA